MSPLAKHPAAATGHEHANQRAVKGGLVEWCTDSNVFKQRTCSHSERLDFQASSHKISKQLSVSGQFPRTRAVRLHRQDNSSRDHT